MNHRVKTFRITRYYIISPDNYLHFYHILTALKQLKKIKTTYRFHKLILKLKENKQTRIPTVRTVQKSNKEIVERSIIDSLLPLEGCQLISSV